MEGKQVSSTATNFYRDKRCDKISVPLRTFREPFMVLLFCIRLLGFSSKLPRYSVSLTLQNTFASFATKRSIRVASLYVSSLRDEFLPNCEDERDTLATSVSRRKPTIPRTSGLARRVRDAINFLQPRNSRSLFPRTQEKRTRDAYSAKADRRGSFKFS